MKTFSKILVFCALSALFSACPRKKPQETKVAVDVSGTEMTNFDSVIQKDMPLAGTNITLLSTSGADAQTLLYGANQPDVFEVSYADRQTLIPFSAPLDQFFASEYDRTTFTLGYYTPGTFGPHYFVPFRLHWLAFLYNREKVPNSPTTPEELADICATHPGGLGIAADDDQALVEFMVTMIWAFGGNELELQDPNTMRTFYFLNNLGACVIKYSENYNNQSLADALAKGEIDFAFADLETTRKLWENGSYPYPIAGAKFPSAKPIAFTGSYLGVNKNSKDPLKAFQAAFYIASPGSCARSMSEGLWLCAMPDVQSVNPPPARVELFKPYLVDPYFLRAAAPAVDFKALAKIYRELFDRIVIKGEPIAIVTSDLEIKIKLLQ